MNDILRWAKEADLWMTSDERIAAVERFAALVRDDEREACAQVCESLFDADDDTCDEAEKCAAAIRKRGES